MVNGGEESKNRALPLVKNQSSVRFITKFVPDFSMAISHWPLSILSSAVAVLNIFLPLLLVRVLSTDEMGIYKQFSLWLIVLPGPFLLSGFVNAIPYWAKASKQNSEELKTACSVTFFLCLLVLIPFLLLPEFWVAPLAIDKALIPLVAVAACSSVIGRLYEESLIGRGLVLKGAIFSVLFEFSRCLLVAAAALITRSVTVTLWVLAGMLLVKSFVAAYYGVREQLFTIKIQASTLFSVLKYAIPLSLAAAFLVPLQYVDQLVLSHYLDDSSFALYALGCLALSPLYLYETSVGKVLVANLANALARSDRVLARQYYATAVHELSLVLVPCAGALIVYAHPIVTLLYTEKYQDADVYLRLFACTYFLLSIPFDVVARASGQSAWILKNSVFFCVLGLLLCGLAAYLTGSAFVVLIIFILVQGAQRAVGLWYTKNLMKMTFSEFFPTALMVRAVVITFLTAGFAYALQPLFVSQLWWLLVTSPLAVCFYLFLASVWKVSLKAQPTVLMISQWLETGGLERMLLGLSTSLQKEQGYRVIVLSYVKASDQNRAGLAELFEKRGIRVIDLNYADGFSPILALRIVEIIMREGVNTVHTHELGPLLYATLAKVFSPQKFTLVHTEHSLIHLSKYKKYQFYERFFSYFANALVAVSETLASQYRQVLGNKRSIQVITNGIELAEVPDLKREEVRAQIIRSCSDPTVAQALRAHEKHDWILYIGRIQPNKGQYRALELWSKLHSSFQSKSLLLFVGPEHASGMVAELRKGASQLPYAENIFYAGATTTPLHWLKAADVYLSCSEFEGMPLSPLEALVCETPCLLSEIPGHNLFSEYAESYPLTESLVGAQKLQKLLDLMRSKSSEFQRILRARSQAIRAQYSSSIMAERYAQLYKELDK